jgi:hypothetical protein
MWPPEHTVKMSPLMEALAAKQDFAVSTLTGQAALWSW